MERMRKFFLLTLLISTTLATAQARDGLNMRGGKSTVEKPSLYVLAIGICEYHNYIRHNPRFACKDAKDFAATIEQVAKADFANVQTTLLVDSDASKAAIESAIRQIIIKARPQDMFIFSYSGHGESKSDRGKVPQFYLVPSDFDMARHDTLSDKAISAAQLQYWFIQVESRHQFIILDSNKSSRGFQEFKARINAENEILRPLARRDIAILSIRSLSFEFDTLRNGLLTYVMLQGLIGGAASSTGAVTVKSLVDYVHSNSQSVLRREKNAKAQALIRRFPGAGEPDVYFSGEDFVLTSKSRPPRAVDNQPGVAEFREVGYRNAFLEDMDQPNQRPDLSDGPSSRYIPKAQCKEVSTILHSPATWGRRGKDTALIIGTDNYEHWDHLSNPVFDANSIAQELNSHYGFETEVLKDPSKDCIGDALLRYGLNKTFADDDQLFIFFGGHGTYLERPVNMGFLITKESPGVDPLGERFFSHALLRRLIDAIPCKHIFLVINACFSGTIDERLQQHVQDTSEGSGMVDFRGNKKDSLQLLKVGFEEDPCDFVTRKMQRRTRQFLTSGGKDVPDGSPGAHSPFANRLLASLQQPNGERPYVFLTQLLPLMVTINPEPLWGEWGGNEKRSEFFFFTSECKRNN
jgi:hypothetical protein